MINLDIGALLGQLQNVAMYVLPFLAMITVLVFFHELGHYFSARRHGVKIEAFAIGLGKELFGWDDRHGTRWKFCMFPMGGYVKMFSDSDPASSPDGEKIAAMTAEEKAVSMYHKTVYQRIEIAAAGPIANYILAFFILSFIYVFHGQPAEAPAAQIGGIVASSPADKAGLLPGDTVLAVGGTAVKTFQELAEAVQKSIDTALDLRVLRGEKNITTHVTFEADSEDKKARRIMGVVPLLIFEKMPVWEAGGAAILRCYDVTVMTLKALGQMIIGERGAQELSGPLGIARATKMSASRSIWDFLWLGAMISLALAIFNFLPIPALDGGHLLFYFIEAVRGTALSIKTQERFMFVGFAILIGVFLFATANDINAMFFR